MRPSPRTALGLAAASVALVLVDSPTVAAAATPTRPSVEHSDGKPRHARRARNAHRNPRMGTAFVHTVIDEHFRGRVGWPIPRGAA